VQLDDSQQRRGSTFAHNQVVRKNNVTQDEARPPSHEWRLGMVIEHVDYKLNAEDAVDAGVAPQLVQGVPAAEVAQRLERQGQDLHIRAVLMTLNDAQQCLHAVCTATSAFVCFDPQETVLQTKLQLCQAVVVVQPRRHLLSEDER
jgi:hypothetical protein